MKHILILTLVFISLISCNNKQNQRTQALDFVSENTNVAFKIGNVENLKTDLNNIGLIFSIASSKKNSPFSSSLLNYLKTDNEIIIALNESGDKPTSQFITKYHDSLFVEDSLNIKLINESVYKKNTIIKKSFENDTIYSTILSGFYIASSNRKQIKNTIDDTSTNTRFSSFTKLKSEASLSVLMISNKKDTLNKKIALFGNLTKFDINPSQHNFNLNGITKNNDSSGILNYISKTYPKENKLASISPNTSNWFLSYTFDDLNKINSNLNSINSVSHYNSNKDLIIEIGSFELENNKALAIRSIDTDAVNESINSTLKESFRQVEINQLNSIDNIKPLFDIFLEDYHANFSFILDDFIIFTKTIDGAKNVISNYTNKTVHANSDAYNNVQENISDESSILYFKISSELDSIISYNLPKIFTDGLLNNDLKKPHSQFIQVVNDNGFSHINIGIEELKKKKRLNSVSEEFNISLGTDLQNNPQIVKNHITKQKDIVVQDIENNLHLISNRGKILWKKKINGSILGNIEQIDIYKNGRLQLVFATSNEIYVLDRNGKNVGSFPMKFSDEITQPLSVFDYDKKRNYRFLVVQGNNTIMYDTKGKQVNGFTFKSASNTIKTQPKHFRVGNKDYIVFGAGNKLYVLNRKGQTRVTAKEAVNFSNNDIYLYKNKFTTTNSNGQLLLVNQKGSISKQNLLLPPEHHFSATSKTLATLSENKLTIRSKSLELDFGDYTAPKIFYLQDKIYVSVTDLQTQKIYLFDSQAKSLPNFPVYGNSSIELANFDKDRNLEFVVKGDSSSIILYQIN